MLKKTPFGEKSMLPSTKEKLPQFQSEESTPMSTLQSMDSFPSISPTAPLVPTIIYPKTTPFSIHRPDREPSDVEQHLQPQTSIVIEEVSFGAGVAGKASDLSFPNAFFAAAFDGCLVLV